ncbi:MAG TPA: DUF3892 domain-containing protein [Mucilaginibacter sp.]|nr:DUF3892 domain-containing protein [Mucilaginibacter sp.]
MSITVRKVVTCISEKGISCKPQERITCIGGYDDGSLWILSVNQAIANIKSGAEEYFILSANNRELNIVVADCEGKQYLKTETDLDSPDNLLGLPSFYGSVIRPYFTKN